LQESGLDPARYCFFTWMREGVRYYRVWEDKKLKEGIAKPVAFGQVSARIKRADAEKLYTVAKRFNSEGSNLRFTAGDGRVRVEDATGKPLAEMSLPVVGGDLRFEEVPGGWRPDQVAHFVNVILVRGQSAEVAYREASLLQPQP
jgi:hypothetical protein